jgi:parvulin-like peptidyl-prolyl isomerase
MQWQRLLRSAAALVGAAAVGCESAPALRAANPGVPPGALVQATAENAGVRLQKADAEAHTVARTSLDVAADPVARGRVMVSVRAVVGKVPIMDDEVNEAALGPLATIHAVSDEDFKRQAKKLKEAILEQLIDREVLVQDAEGKLLKAGKKDLLDQVKKDGTEQYRQWLKRARAGFKSDEEFETFLRERGTSLKSQERMRQRMMLAEQYLHSSVMRHVEHRCGPSEIRDYYRSHPEEFQRGDSVQWQDIFLDAGKTDNYRTREAAYRKALELVARARSGDTDDFVKLCEEHDDGLAKVQKEKGSGIGTRRDNISPPEAAALLFQMQDGEVGPVVVVPAGFHVIRLVKRTHAGLAPFDEEVQKKIKDKLREEAYQLESKKFLQELKDGVHIERVPYGP